MSLPSGKGRRTLGSSGTPRPNPRAVHFVSPPDGHKKADNVPGCSKKCLGALVSDPVDSVESLGAEGSPGTCNILYKNSLQVTGTDKGYEPGADSTDDWEDADKLEIKNRTVRPDQCGVLETQSRPDLVPGTRLGGFLRVLARSLQHCSLSIAAGFGLSHQHTAWYKHCWHSPSSTQTRDSLQLMDQLHEMREVRRPGSPTPSSRRPVSSCTEL
ncbi:uncharacterized protein [Drosophila bipectinata]|uniref:uncharacterized protein n=1 Tax=Drosophila bipectinata TaxID=42026 RepID=UPI001C8A3C10|nr:uncharacterized protein LOC122321055 [Drosophila bipectinata]